jgi:hypothetical protein
MLIICAYKIGCSMSCDQELSNIIIQPVVVGCPASLLIEIMGGQVCEYVRMKEIFWDECCCH